MGWRTARRLIVVIYGLSFVVLGGLLLQSAVSARGEPGAIGPLIVGALFLAEAIGLFTFHWLARFALKLALAGVALFYFTLVAIHAKWGTILFPLSLAAILIVELGFRTLDRKIAAHR